MKLVLFSGDFDEKCKYLEIKMLRMQHKFEKFMLYANDQNSVVYGNG